MSGIPGIPLKFQLYPDCLTAPDPAPEPPNGRGLFERARPNAAGEAGAKALGGPNGCGFSGFVVS